MSTLSLSFFGSIEVSHDSEQIAISARKALALLAYLAVMERPQSRERLAALLWPEADESRARANLRGALWALNQTPVGERIDATVETLELRRDGVEVDVVRFEGRVEREDEIAALTEAARLYRGDFLEGFYLADNSEFEAWAAARRDHYRRRALDALHNLAEHHLSAGRYDEAGALARRQIAIDDLRESAYRQLFLALSGAGQRAAALKEYERLCAHLSKEVGVGPSEATEAVVGRVRAGEVDVKGTGDGVPAVTSAGGRQSSQAEAIPPSPYRGLFAYREEDAPYFFGREAFTERLRSAVDGQSLVPVVGPTGSGKTSVVYAGLVASWCRRLS